MGSNRQTKTAVASTFAELSPFPQPESLPAPMCQPINAHSAPAEFTIYLSPRDMQIVTATPAVLGKDGVLWVTIRGGECRLSAVGECSAFTHKTSTGAPSDIATEFGLTGNALASVAKWTLKHHPGFPLELTVASHTETVLAKPEKRATMPNLNRNMPTESALFNIEGGTIFDEVDEKLLMKFFDDKRQVWPIDRWSKRPEALDAFTATTNGIPVDHRALFYGLQGARRSTSKRKPLRPPIHLRDGYIVMGNQDLVFWFEVPTLAGYDIALPPERLSQSVDLLSFLPTSEPCQLEKLPEWLTLDNGRTRIGLKTTDQPHPADIARMRQGEPEHAVQIDAGKLRTQISACKGGEGVNDKFIWLHVQLVQAKPYVLQTQGRTPHSGKQRGKGAAIDCEAVDPGAELNVLASLDEVEQSLANLGGKVSLRATSKSLYISGQIAGGNVKRTAKLPVIPAEPPEKLAHQVRRISSEWNLNPGPTR